MKRDSNAGISQPLINKAKKQLTIRRGRGDQIVIQKRRKPRGNRGTPNQASWVRDFTTAAGLAKDMDGCTAQQARAFADAPPAGYTFWRDYFSTAYAGKLIAHWGNTNINPQTPRIDSLRPAEVWRVTTPTANVTTSTPQTLTAGVAETLIPDTVIWDNNAFWAPTEHPTRLTTRASGLYIVVMTVDFNAVNGGNRRIQAIINGTDVYPLFMGPPGGTFNVRGQGLIIWPFAAGDYVECSVLSSQPGSTALLRAFVILAMTPESII